MSRCYTFPPPGYVRNETMDESLIESIKGTKEEAKREKRHSKHKKHKKRKEKENEAERSSKHRHHKRRRKEESANPSKKVDDSRELIDDKVVELLDKSCLTMELELQTSSQNSCDSTLRSNERPKQVQSQQTLDGMHNDSETRIPSWLLEKGHKDLEAKVMMLTDKDDKKQRLSQAAHAAHAESVGHTYSASTNEAPRDYLRVSQEKKKDPIFGLSREIATRVKASHRETSMQPSSNHQEAIVPSKLLCSKCLPSTFSRFLNLVENWAPNRVESKPADSEDQEWWLFMKSGTKRNRQVSNQTITSNGSSLTVWPAARFLPEAEVYALPFTVPF